MQDIEGVIAETMSLRRSEGLDECTVIVTAPR